MTVVVKLGGEVLAGAGRAGVAAEIAGLVRAGKRVVVVHGGGAQTSELQEKLGQKPRKIAGRRVTDEGALDALKMVVCGKLNVELCAAPRPDGMLPMAVGGDMEAADATFIPDWPLHWVRALHNLYRYTGDAELVARLLAPAERLLRWFEPFQGEDGLLANVTGWVLIDWSAVSVTGASAALNALWARALGLVVFAVLTAWFLATGERPV